MLKKFLYKIKIKCLINSKNNINPTFHTALLSCSESHIFSDKKNLNTALNDLFKGDFYSCNLIDDNDLENKKFKYNSKFNLHQYYDWLNL